MNQSRRPQDKRAKIDRLPLVPHGLDAQLVGVLLKLYLAELDGLESLIGAGLLDLGGELLFADGDFQLGALAPAGRN